MEKYLFSIQDVEVGKLNALVNNIMKQTRTKDPNEAIRLVNSKEWILVNSVSYLSEKDNVMRFSLTSDGATGDQWIARLKSKGFSISDYVKNILLSTDFKPTSNFNYEISVFKGMIWFDNVRIIKNITENTSKCQFSALNAEIICLIREKFSDKELKSIGLYWIVTLLSTLRDDDRSCLKGYYVNPDPW